jgi:hypothetical protein
VVRRKVTDVSEERKASIFSKRATSDRVIAQAARCRLPTVAARVHTRLRDVGFVVDKVALGQVFTEYFGFPCQFSFHRLLHIQHHLSSEVGTIGQLVADVPSELSLTN